MKHTLLLMIVAIAAQGDDSPLFDLIRAGDLAALRSALRDGSDANAADEQGRTALHYAALYSTAEAMAILLEHQAKPDAVDHAGVTPLMTSISDLAKVRLLVSKGADVNARAATGNTPLRLAAALEAGVPIAELLLARGARPDAAAVRGAAFFCQTELTRKLLAAGGTSTGQAVADAAACPEPALLRMLLDKTTEPVPVDRQTRRSALMDAAYFAPAKSVRLLLAHGIGVNETDYQGRTALMYAAGREHASPEIVKLLLDSGADRTTKDIRGDKAADFARRSAHRELMQSLGGRDERVAHTRPPERELPPVRDALQRALALLDAAGPRFFKANGCISCHNQSIPQMAAGQLRAAGISSDAAAAKAQLNAVVGVWRSGLDRMWQTSCNMNGGRVATVTYGLVGLAAAGQPMTPVIDAAIHCLASLQAPDGSWSILDARQPLGMDAIKYTALGMRAMQLYPLPGRRAEFAERISRARRFLEQARPFTNQERAFRILGMKWAGSDTAVIRKDAGKLAALQRPDGGWAQRPGLESDAFATAQSLWALREGAGYMLSHPGWQRGAHYLRATQQGDGSWHVRSRGFSIQPYRETGFPHEHDQWISAAATGFAIIALAPLAEDATQTAKSLPPAGP